MSRTATPFGSTALPDPEIAQRTRGSLSYMEDARKVLCRGVSSAARIRSNPIVLRSGAGSKVTDVDGNEYVDLVCGLGPILLGHAPRAVIEAATRAAHAGAMLGAPGPGEAELARRLIDVIPCADRVILSTTGSEAIQIAVRIARAATGRNAIVRFEGHFHGWIDPVYTNAPGTPPADAATAEPLPIVSNTPGAEPPDDVLVARWNDRESLEATLEAARGTAACVVMEPLPCNMGTLQPHPGYVAAVRELCDRYGALLIFDEVLTGFRLALGGAQELLAVVPDLAVYSKALASGFPISAVCGRDAVMAAADSGPVRSAGTYAGNALSVAAAVATLDEIVDRSPRLYEQLEALGARLQDGLLDAAASAGAPLSVRRAGSVLQLLWGTGDDLRAYADVMTTDAGAVANLAEGVARYGIFAAPRGLLLVSAAHTDADIDRAVAAFAAELAARPTPIGTSTENVSS